MSKQNKNKPLISYYGGKQRLARKIVPWLAPHTVYTEPFAGGLAVMFKKGLPAISSTNFYREVVNDNSKLLVNFYNVVRSKGKKLKKLIKFTPYSLEDFKEASKIVREGGSGDSLKDAWAYYIAVQFAFSNTIGRGFSKSASGRNHANTHFKNVLNFNLDRMQYCTVDNLDALKFISVWDSPQTCHYIDPPYPKAHQGHYAGYTVDDWKNLCNLLDSCKSSYVLSNYAQSVEPKSAQYRIALTAHSSAQKHGNKAKGKRVEVLWICDRSGGIRKDIKPKAFKNYYSIREQLKIGENEGLKIIKSRV